MDNQTGRLDTAAVAVVFETLLLQHPHARVAAINPDGLFTTMPSSVPLRGQQAIPGRSGLDVVVQEDRESLIRAWEAVLVHGAARVEVMLSTAPPEPAIIHYLDLRASYGIFIAVLVGARDEDGLAALRDVSHPPSPRIARVRKNELAVYLAVDEATTQILGWKPQELVGRRSLEFVHPDDQERAIQSWMQTLEGGGVLPVRFRHRRADGGWTWFEVANRNLLADPEHRCVSADMVDISDEMVAHEALRIREHLLGVLTEALPIGVLEISPDRCIAYANERLGRIMGTGPQASLDEHLARVHPADRSKLKDALDSALSLGIDNDLEIQVAGVDDRSWLRCLVRIRALADQGDLNSGAVVCVEDVTAARAADEDMRRLAAAVEHSGDTVVISDLGGRVVYVNPAFERAVGYRRDELVGQTPDITTPILGMSPDDRSIWTALQAGRSWSGTLQNRHKDGHAVEFDVLVTLVRDRNGAPIGSVGLGRDLTREHALEAQVHQAQKMEAVGQLAGGIAHDFNNLLTIIRGYAELHLAAHARDDPARADVIEIERAAERAARLTGQLLAFSRRQPGQPSIVDLGDAVAAAVPLLAGLLGERIQLVTSNRGGPLWVSADRGQFEQMLVNLVTNAHDAMPDGGCLTIETSLTMLDEEFSRAHPEARPGPHATLAVSDTGIGMSAEVQVHLFEPFYTTKERGKGTGLGLASVYGIVKQAAGFIDVQSELGRGTTFRIHWPVQMPAPTTESSAGATEGPIGLERGTILLVEDEPGVLAVAIRALEAHGYTIRAFGDPLEALAFAGENPDAFDALVTDVVMPGMTGPALASRLNEWRPQLRVLFMSGYDPEGVEGARLPLIAKPFTSEGLAAAVRSLLNPGEGA
jgi:two-component system, cell cycle sensor histidine kinase and response regulator CckA